MSQTKAGEPTASFVPGRWSVQATSRAERCDGPHIKRWSVDDLYCLAAALEVPVTYFLLGLDGDERQQQGSVPAKAKGDPRKRARMRPVQPSAKA